MEKANKLTHKREAAAKKQLEKDNKGEDTKKSIQSRPCYAVPLPISTVIVKKSFWRHTLNVIRKGWQFIIFLTTISALFVFRDQIHTWITPREKLWKEKTYLNGIIIPNETLRGYSSLYVVIGSRNKNNFGYSQEMLIDKLADTLIFNPKVPGIILPGGDTPFNLRFLLQNHHLFIATTFKDIDDKYVGKMDFTTWELKSSRISNYHDGDDNMEIIDENNYVLFNMRYEYPNIIKINGYYTGEDAYQIAGDSTLSGIRKDSPDSKQEAIKLIRGITPLNTY